MDKYHTTSENLKVTILKYGVAIIPQVLDDKECQKMLDGMWNFFEHITQKFPTPLDRNDEKTWREFYKLSPLHGMLVQHHQVGHCQASWDVRQNPKVVDVFAKLWDCKHEDLLVSFDGLSFSLPPEETNKGWHQKTWFHTDQSFTNNDFACVQSWVTAKDVHEGDATLAFLEKSNRYHKDFAKKFKVTDKTNWYKFSDDELKFYVEEKHCKMGKIVCNKGDMVFWCSRLVHCGSEPVKSRKEANLRAVIYICYLPRILSNEKELQKKQKAFNELRTTSHYPQKIKLFPKMPRTYGNEIPEITSIDKPDLTELGLRLAGF